MKVGDHARDSASKFTGVIIGLDQSGVPTVIHRALLQALAPGGLGKVGDKHPELWVDAADVQLLDGAGNVIVENGDAKEAHETASANASSAAAAVTKQQTETVGKTTKPTEAERLAADKANHDAAEARIANEKLKAGGGAIPDNAAGVHVEGLKVPDPNAKAAPAAASTAQPSTAGGTAPAAAKTA